VGGPPVSAPTAVPTKRLLTLWDLIFFGSILVEPVAHARREILDCDFYTFQESSITDKDHRCHLHI
jgi:hypothetical protein